MVFWRRVPLTSYDTSGNDPIKSLLETPSVRWVYMKDTPRFMSYVPRYLWVLLAPWKVLHQIRTLLYALLVRLPHPPQYILVQVRYLLLVVNDIDGLRIEPADHPHTCTRVARREAAREQSHHRLAQPWVLRPCPSPGGTSPTS
jgi:hypothetical protein